jgi:hypothetical protein
VIKNIGGVIMIHVSIIKKTKKGAHAHEWTDLGTNMMAVRQKVEQVLKTQYRGVPVEVHMDTDVESGRLWARQAVDYYAHEPHYERKVYGERPFSDYRHPSHKESDFVQDIALWPRDHELKVLRA